MASSLGDPTIVLGAPTLGVGIFDVGVINTAGDFVFQFGPSTSNGFYLYHTCDPYVTGGFYAAFIDTSKNPDGSVNYENKAVCARGYFSYGSDGALARSVGFADYDFSMTHHEIGKRICDRLHGDCRNGVFPGRSHHCDSSKNPDGTVNYENKAVCARGRFAYGSDGAIQLIIGFADYDFATACRSCRRRRTARRKRSRRSPRCQCPRRRQILLFVAVRSGC
ncbi:hypothetical protein JKP88DRAFT_251451 [Tribonema minus]|uniref:Uncharacterized protein n=1 Tax=Tribonema minus TaxID=303371 RepID=A0A836CM29_9STRA|nr:hypothetical protein JKP88DRAFT_251451 [Tribonema minus]